MPVDTEALTSAMRSWAAESPRMERLQRALHALYGRRPGHAVPSLVELAGHVLLLIARGHEGRVTRLVRELDASLARLLDDVHALRTGTSLPGRTPDQYRQDMQTLRRAIEEISTLQEEARTILAHGTAESRVDDLRGQLLADLSPGAARPGPRPTGGPAIVVGPAQPIDELRAALAGAPSPRAGSRPLTARQLAALPEEALQAALALVRALGDDPSKGIPNTIAHLLATAPPEELDRLVYASLQASGRLVPGTRAPTTAWGAHQVAVTGSLIEWTGNLVAPVRGMETIGIDGIVGAWVVDAKLTAEFAEQSGHLVGRTPLPPGEREIQTGARSYRRGRPRDVFEQIQRGLEGPATLAEELAWSERFDIQTMSEVERQLQFAKENGLLGVRWVATTEAVGRVFEERFVERLRDVLGEALELQVVW